MKEERKRILKLVEEGKMTVDEALFLIEQLEQGKGSQESNSTSLSPSVKFEEAKKEDFNTYKFNSVKDKVLDFVDTAFKKIKDFDLDLNFGQSVDITHIFQQGDAILNQIDIDMANGSVKLVPWEQKDVRIECSAKVYRVENQDEARRKFLEDAIFAIEGQKLRFSVQQKWMKVDSVVHVPKEDYENVRIRLFNGSIEGENLKVKDCRAKTANGKVLLENLDCGKLETETANGQIGIHRSSIRDLEAETINGAIKADGYFNQVDLQSFNGNLTCTVNNNDCENIEVKATTGSIDVFLPEKTPASGELKSNLGGFTIELDGIQVVEEKSDMVQKTLRFKPAEGGLHAVRLHADTKTGSIVVKKLIR
ncbi:DUF4097 family beta strand repeat-containing protein [Mesobacillus subterraneus]|uniref:DUF4097 domain-containing protein n=1 Tax=Mesobacillus subterraneus TaxID=285983 RepID=A0A427TL56_9BACI|nr:DUF4097 domain-containing protein [Mesobacillus subterraneus]RSD25145.1 DUF4097 domain-containing protein [Mesobacillus subterraneus]